MGGCLINKAPPAIDNYGATLYSARSSRKKMKKRSKTAMAASVNGNEC